VEDAIDMSEPKHILHRGAQSEENEILLQALRVLEDLDECGESGAVDIS
jgi:hypothetical protein